MDEGVQFAWQLRCLRVDGNKGKNSNDGHRASTRRYNRKRSSRAVNDWWFVSDYAAFAAGNGGKALLPDLFMRGPSATASNDGCDVATPILVCSLGRLPAAWQWEWDCLIPPVQP